MPASKDFLNFGKRVAAKMAPAAKTALKKSGELLETAREEAEKFGTDLAKSYQDAQAKQAAEKEAEDSFRIPPWYILAGLGSLNRRTLCDYLAVFECISLRNLSLDGAQDLLDKLKKSARAETERAFLKRIRTASDEYYAGTSPPRAAALRFRMWSEMRAALDLPKSLPLSTDSANHQCAEVADLASKYHDIKTQSEGEREKPGQKMGRVAAESVRKIQDRLARKQPDFTQTVRQEAHDMLLRALKGSQLTPEQQQKIRDEFLNKLHQMPDDMRDRSLEEAIRSGDGASMAAALSAATLTSVAAVVEIAGFSAYIAAAKISTIIPLLGGKTAVSLLAVLANPLFVIPAAAGGVYVMDRRLKKNIGRTVASRLAVLLALQGLASRSDGLKQCLDDFKDLTDDEISDDRLARQRATVKATSSAWAPTPGSPKTNLPAIQETREADALMATLFPSSQDTTLNVAAVAGLTAADILFDAMAIDPQVAAAADFSRAEDIDNIFRFGAFATRFESMEGAAQAGAENQLRGYVAEMTVATRLGEEHDVSLPETANNPGYDLLVDGQPFQVKCSGNPDSGMHMLERHFEKYPDTPVYANSELVETVRDSDAPWADQVFGVEGFDYAKTDEIMKESLGAGADLMDPQFPIFAIAVSAARNIHGWWKGSIPLRDIPLEVAVDGAIHGSLSAAGGLAGGGVGLLLFGPAGAVIFGGAGQAVALFGAGSVRQTFDDWRTKTWSASVGEAANALKTALGEAMQSKIRRIHSKAARIKVSDPAMEDWARLKFADRALCVAECKAELDCLPAHPVARARELLKLMRKAGVHPRSVDQSLRNLMNILAEKPRVTDQAAERTHQVAETVSGQVNKAVGKGKQWYDQKRSGDAQ